MRKITTLLTLLLVAVGVSAQSWTIDVESGNGTYYRRDGVTEASSSQWAATFISNVAGAPVVTVTNYDNTTNQPEHKFASPSNTANRKSFSSGTDITWTISVEGGYVITGYSIVGSSNGSDITITPVKGGNATTFKKGSTSTLNVDGLAEQSTTFNVTASGDNGLAYSKYQIKVAKVYEVTVNTSTGSFTLGNATGTWNREWVSTETDPQVTVRACNAGTTTMVNNMGVISGSTNIDFRSGSAANSDYIISCSDGYIIVAGSFTGAARNASYPQTVTVEGNDKEFTTTTETFNFPVDSHAKSFNFNLTGSNSGGLAGEIKVVMIKPTTVNVTYNVYMNGSLTASEQVSADLGYAPVLPANLKRDFLTYGAFDVAEITSTTTDVNVDATWTGPFDYSADFDNATWYNLRVKDEAYVTYVSANTPNIEADRSLTERLPSNQAIQWAFVGDPINGFKIYNREAGSTLVMGTAASSGGSSSKASLQASGSQVVENWIVKTSSYITNGFFLTDGTYALNFRQSPNVNLAHWTGGADLGSTFTAFDAENFYEQVMNEIKPVYDNAGKPFYTSLASVAPMQALIEQVVNTSFCSQSDYETLLQYVQDAANTGYLYPETGYYRIKSSGARTGATYLSYKANISLWSGDSRTGLFTVAEANKLSDLSTVLFLDRQTDGTYKISSQGMSLQNQTTNDKAFPMTSAEGANFTFRIYTPGVVAITSDFATQGYLHESNWGENKAGVVRWEFGADASHWTVEEAGEISVAMNAAAGKAYATFYAPFDATFTNVTAYTITRGAAVTEGHEAVLTEVTGVVPAGTPVVLVDETGTVAAATANVSYGAAALGVENILSGHYLAGTVADGSLVLGQSNGVPGFYKYKSYATKLGANRAFIAPENASNIRALVFVDPTTGISTTTLNTENGNAYDLQGRRVQNTQKGLYIINGKKVIVQ